MTVRHKGSSQYVFNRLKIQRRAPERQNLRAGPIDAQVAAAFLQPVAPTEIDALSKARKTIASIRKSPAAIREATISPVGTWLTSLWGSDLSARVNGDPLHEAT